MKMIRPIVNISKIIDNYDAVIVGFRGVLTEGDSIKQDAVNALVNIRKAGKESCFARTLPYVQLKLPTSLSAIKCLSKFLTLLFLPVKFCTIN